MQWFTTARVAWGMGLAETVCAVIAALLSANKADAALFLLMTRGAFESLRAYLANNPIPKV